MTGHDPAGAARLAGLFHDAFARGQAALAHGDRGKAIRWLDRAHRLSGKGVTAALSLAAALTGHDTARAIALFRRVLASNDIRDAWLGLATAHYTLGDMTAARDALASAFHRHAAHEAIGPIADHVARATGAAGWCALTQEGEPVIRPARQGIVEIRADGRVAHDPQDRKTARRLTVTLNGEALIGSPLLPLAVSRAEGYAESWSGGVRGWIWHPGAPDADPQVTFTAGGWSRYITATSPVEGIEGLPPLARPRAFGIVWSDLPASETFLHVRDRGGRDLTGSPVWRDGLGADRTAEPGPKGSRRPAIATVAPVIAARLRPLRDNLTILIRLAPDPDAAHALLTRLQATMDRDVPVRLADSEGEGLIPGRDTILLDGRAILPPGWLDKLRGAAHASPDIGMLVPFSNIGPTACPRPEGVSLSWLAWTGETVEDTVARLDRLSRRGGHVKTIGLPVLPLPPHNAPCLFLRGDCLTATGDFRPAPFAGGVGTREDFALRAGDRGWRIAAIPGLFIGTADTTTPEHDPHRAPSRAAALLLRARNESILKRLHPGARQPPADPLAAPRRGFDLARWRDVQPPSVVFITHDDGGGVARRVHEAAAAREKQGYRAIILRPMANVSVRGEWGVRVDGVERDRFPALRFVMPREKVAFNRFLRDSGVMEAEIHHFLNLDPLVIESVLALDVPFDVHIHDFIWFCPRIALLGAGYRYCGEPKPSVCDRCVADNGTYLREDIPAAALIARSRAILSAAREVFAPSRDTAGRMIRHFPRIAVTVAPHEDDTAMEEPPPIPRVTGMVRVCVAGGISPHKGFPVLLACARDARARGLGLFYAVVGTTDDDQALLDTGHAFVTGRYEPGEAVALIRQQNAALGFLPSLSPETWSLTLTELWRAGLRVAAFDIGAPAERIRHTGHGFLLPLGFSPQAINDTLLRAVGMGVS